MECEAAGWYPPTVKPFVVNTDWLMKSAVIVTHVVVYLQATFRRLSKRLSITVAFSFDF